MPQHLERNTRTISLLTLVSRCTGLVRDGAISRIFGAGGLSSSLYFAIMIPNLFRRLFGEGALSAAFLPVYTELERDDPAVAKSLASLLMASLAIVLGIIVILGEIVLASLVAMQDEPSEALWLAMITLPYAPLICIVAMLSAMLHVHNRFGAPAAAPIILNGSMITAVLGWHLYDGAPTRLAIGIVAASVVVGGVLQVLWCLHALRGTSWWTRTMAPASAAMRKVVRRTLPMIVGIGTLQLNTLIDGGIASWPLLFGDTIGGVLYPLQDGAMASLSFAQRLYQFPLGVFGIAVATAAFPMLARQAKNPDAFADTLRRGLRLVVFIGLPAGAGLILVREPLAAAVFQGGFFSAADTAEVGWILLGYAPAIWAYSMTQILVRAFYAKDDAARPVRVAMGVVALNLLLNMTLIWTPLRTAGLAWSTAICAVVQVSILLRMVRRHVDDPVDASVLGSWARSAIATAIMGGMVAIVGLFVWNDGGTWGQSVVALLIMAATGMASFAIVGALLGMRELGWLIRGR
ncbi:MAG: murein biosynthesis integral membrane protein MurJ [Phycisphaerales bacterium]|nr:murein biosynthesis integral membrane protein MurJ [Phycisphaerales bacterium]